MSQDLKRLTLFASQVAAITGQNPYRHPVQELEKIWLRFDQGRHFQVAQAKFEPTWQTTEAKIQAQVTSQQQVITDQYIQQVEAKTLNVDEVLKKIQNISHNPGVVQYLKQYIKTEIGSRREEAMLQIDESITHNNDQFYYKFLFEMNDLKVGVGGKIDGLKNGRLIEIKNRKSRFMQPLPLYDIIQLHIYMYLLDLKEGDLVEQVILKTKTKQQTTTVHWDQVLWDQLQEKIKLFVKKFQIFLNTPDLQASYLACNSIQDYQDWWESLEY